MGSEPVTETETASEAEIRTVTVLIENTYTCGRESSATVTLAAPAPGRDLEVFWDVVHERTGDGHPCGSSEHALYEVRITEAPGRPELVGEWMSWEG